MFYLSLLFLFSYNLCLAMDTSGLSASEAEQTGQPITTLYEKDLFNLDDHLNKMTDRELALVYKKASDVYADKRLADSPHINREKALRKKLFDILIKQDPDTINNVLHGLQGDQSDDEQDAKFIDQPWMIYYERSKKATALTEANKIKISNTEKEIELDQKKEEAYDLKISELESQLMNLKLEKCNISTQKVFKKAEIDDITATNDILKKSLRANELLLTKKLNQLDKEIISHTEQLNILDCTIRNLTANLGESSLLKKQLTEETEKRSTLKTMLDNQIKIKKEIEFRLGKINEPRLSVTEKLASGAWSLLGYKNT